MCLQTKPPGARSGYVHLVSLHTGHLYASVPTDMRTKAECEQIILLLHNCSLMTVHYNK